MTNRMQENTTTPERANMGCGSLLQDNENKPVDSGAHLTFEEVFTFEHLMASAHKCGHGVRWKASVQMFEVDRMKWVSDLQKQVLEGSYKSMGFREFWLTERGKRRHIQSVHVSERCVQKCLNEYGLKPIILPRLIYDNAASIPGKGTEFALKRLRKHLATHYRNHGRSGGVLVCDFKNYFGSIPHDTLFRMLRRVISDDQLFALSKYFIDQFDDPGLGLGSEVSQIAAVYYPSALDHYVKERLHIKGYGRYMDDFYLIHEDISHLRFCLKEIERIAESYGLMLNSKTQIIRFGESSFEYLKRRFTISETGRVVTRLTRNNITRRRRTLKKQAANNIDATQSYASWKGYACKWDSGRTVREMDQLYLELFGGNY